jgi:phosphoribosylaminoimidazolecarboxamide formyltransferase / IMP cyclohydrolase
MFKNALVSVSDKTGLEEFLQPYAKKGMRIVSSGGTAQYLIEKGFSVTKVSEQTQHPEVMGGRVKTLHPRIHMPLLCRTDEPDDMLILKEQGLEPFDLVVVNLYPFSQALESGKPHKDMIEHIDIGGPTLLRASAKSHDHITVVCDPSDYSWVQKKTEVDIDDRKRLAAKVFRHVSQYDQLIGKYLDESNHSESLSISAQFHSQLRYGENPQQQGMWYSDQEKGLHQAQIRQGKPLSYNNILDLDAALKCLSLFTKPTVVSVKHNNPCGVATSDQIAQALELSLKADPVSVFGGIIALNRKIDKECAEQLQNLFLECIIAPDLDETAASILASKKNLRVLTWPQVKNLWELGERQELKSVMGGYLGQTADQVQSQSEEWELVCGSLDQEDWLGLELSWKVVAALKSNAIAICNQSQSLGLGMGQVNRVDAVKQAFERADQFHPQEKRRYLASDAFFPFPDSIKLAHEYGVSAIIQPGGSVKDKDVIAAAKELNIPMVLTGRRHFRH